MQSACQMRRRERHPPARPGDACQAGLENVEESPQGALPKMQARALPAAALQSSHAPMPTSTPHRGAGAAPCQRTRRSALLDLPPPLEAPAPPVRSAGAGRRGRGSCIAGQPLGHWSPGLAASWRRPPAVPPHTRPARDVAARLPTPLTCSLTSVPSSSMQWCQPPRPTARCTTARWPCSELLVRLLPTMRTTAPRGRAGDAPGWPPAAAAAPSSQGGSHESHSVFIRGTGQGKQRPPAGERLHCILDVLVWLCA